MNAFEFNRDLRRQQTKSPGLSRGIVCVILFSYLSRTLTCDRQTHDDGTYHVSMYKQWQSMVSLLLSSSVATADVVMLFLCFWYFVCFDIFGFSTGSIVHIAKRRLFKLLRGRF